MVPLNEDSPEQGVCAICQDLLKEAVSTDCGHLFCRVCLTQHAKKASRDLCCPLCRKPCSKGVLGEGYLCHRHQKRVCSFCEESKLLLCVECLESPEHRSHLEPTIGDAISHYKERLNRRSRRLRKDLTELQRLKAQEEKKRQALQIDCGKYRLHAELESQHQTEGQLDALPLQELGQLEHTSAEGAGTLNLSEAVTQLGTLVADLERTAKELDANTLKNASDLLNSWSGAPLGLPPPEHSLISSARQPCHYASPSDTDTASSLSQAHLCGSLCEGQSQAPQGH